jgi:general secretion pathway protein B
MSLILDALRKSEAERRRGQAPSIHSATPTPSTRRQPPWSTLLPIAGGVLLLLAAAVFWLRDDAPVTKEELVEDADSPSLVPAIHDAGAAPTAPPPAAATPPPLPVAAPAAAPPAGAATAPGVDALVKPAHPPGVAPGAPTIASAPTNPAAVPAPPASAAAVDATPPDEALPPMAVLDPTQRAALPPLKLSMHVYDVDPARRFAIIDGQRVTEGAQMGNAIVLEIRRDGVVLDVAGRRVLLPRP